MTSQVEHGYLVLADISGYTSYLAEVELEHAQEILTNLLAGVVEQFKALLTISKLEGDAVFATLNELQAPRPEVLLELIEATYQAFILRRDSAQRRTSCTCRACQSISSLDLKFFVHQGVYIVQNISGMRELVGTDVNLVHRLAKNHITENTGWKAYALFTESAVQKLDLHQEKIHRQVEAYDYLGDVETQSFDLRARCAALADAHPVVISVEEADLTLRDEFAVPVALFWQLITDPQTLNLTMREGGKWTVISRPGGRSGIGARNHCAHGKGPGMDYLYLDWRPFHYFTAEAQEGNLKHLEMFQVDPTADGLHTLFTVRLKLVTPLPKAINKIICALVAKKQFLEFFERSRELIAEMVQADR